MNSNLFLNQEVISPYPPIEQALTSDIRFSPLEIEVESNLSAAMADAAEVDRRSWAILGETMEESPGSSEAVRCVMVAVLSEETGAPVAQ